MRNIDLRTHRSWSDQEGKANNGTQWSDESIGVWWWGWSWQDHLCWRKWLDGTVGEGGLVVTMVTWAACSMLSTPVICQPTNCCCCSVELSSVSVFWAAACASHMPALTSLQQAQHQKCNKAAKSVEAQQSQWEREQSTNFSDSFSDFSGFGLLLMVK